MACGGTSGSFDGRRRHGRGEARRGVVAGFGVFDGGGGFWRWDDEGDVRGEKKEGKKRRAIKMRAEVLR